MGDTLDGRVTRLEAGLQTLSAHVSRLENDISDIRATLKQTATKADVALINAKIEQSINVILRDAINAMPAKQAALWGAVAAICTIGMFILTIMQHH